MKFRYWLSILLVIVVAIIVVGVSSCGSSSMVVTPPVFLNAQKLRGKRPPQQVKGPGVIGKAQAPAKDFGPKCTSGDEYCVYVGVPQKMCKALTCLRPPKNGDPCKYTTTGEYSDNCVKASPPPPTKAPEVIGPKCEQGDTDCVLAGLVVAPPPEQQSFQDIKPTNIVSPVGGKCPAGLVLKRVGVNACEPNKPCPKIARFADACVQPESV